MKTQAILAIVLIAMTNYVSANYCPVVPPISGPQQTTPATYGSIPHPVSQPTHTVYSPDTPDMSDTPPTSTPSYIPVTYPVGVSSVRSYPMSTGYTSTQTTSSASSHAVDATGLASVSVEIGWTVLAMSLIFASFVATSFGVGIVL